MERNNKKEKLYPIEEETGQVHHDDLKNAYGLSKKERMFNSHLNNRKIQDLKTLASSVKSILIKEKVVTVAELKDNSLNFLLDFNGESDQMNEKLATFHECKRFLNSIDFSNGKDYLEY